MSDRTFRYQNLSRFGWPNGLNSTLISGMNVRNFDNWPAKQEVRGALARLVFWYQQFQELKISGRSPSISKFKRSNKIPTFCNVMLVHFQLGHDYFSISSVFLFNRALSLRTYSKTSKLQLIGIAKGWSMNGWKWYGLKGHNWKMLWTKWLVTWCNLEPLVLVSPFNQSFHLYLPSKFTDRVSNLLDGAKINSERNNLPQKVQFASSSFTFYVICKHCHYFTSVLPVALFQTKNKQQ